MQSPWVTALPRPHPDVQGPRVGPCLGLPGASTARAQPVAAAGPASPVSRQGPDAAGPSRPTGTPRTCCRTQRGRAALWGVLGTEEYVEKTLLNGHLLGKLRRCLLPNERVYRPLCPSACVPRGQQRGPTPAHVLLPTWSRLPSPVGWASSVPSRPCLLPPSPDSRGSDSAQVWSPLQPPTRRPCSQDTGPAPQGTLSAVRPPYPVRGHPA